jgi:PBP1b-binding outer membrane lipoprotein LpoB
MLKNLSALFCILLASFLFSGCATQKAAPSSDYSNPASLLVESCPADTANVGWTLQFPVSRP